MKKIWMILTALLLLSALLLSGAAAEEHDEGSIPGSRTIAERLPRVRDIWDEKEAEIYAITLWPMISNDPLPEGSREINYDKRENSYHFMILDENRCACYTADFFSNGVVQQLHSFDPDKTAEALELVTYRDASELADGSWDAAGEQISEQVEKLAPGLLKLMEPLCLDCIRDTGDRQELTVFAAPLDPEWKTCLSIGAILYPDNRCELKSFSLYAD